jgi:hypothetical protein
MLSAQLSPFHNVNKTMLRTPEFVFHIQYIDISRLEYYCVLIRHHNPFLTMFSWIAPTPPCSHLRRNYTLYALEQKPFDKIRSDT